MVDALNWMHGYKETADVKSAVYPLEHNEDSVDPIHLEVLARLNAATQRETTEAPSPQAALGLLLRGRPPYDVRPGGVSVAPFKIELLSLPADVHACPQVADLLSEKALSFLEGYQERMLRDDVCETEKVFEFMDPTLKYNQKKYQRLIGDLHRRGLVRVLDHGL